MTIKRYSFGDDFGEPGMVPDHAGDYVEYDDHLALVAAAYRDAAEQCQKERWNVSHLLSNPPQSDAARMIGLHIAARAPADAEAHLTALLRAEYERGVREAAGAMKPMLRSMISRGDAHTTILTLLKQEGR